MSPNGTHHPTGASSYDADLDALYAWMPPARPTPPPLPEAAFSLTLKGTLDGQEALLTARGATTAEFKRNLAGIRGLLDPVAQPRSTPVETGKPQGQGWCAVHNVSMKLQQKGERTWYSHWTENGTWCKGKGK